MTFDATITVGTILQTLVLAGVVIGAYTRISGRIVSLETKVSLLYDWWAGEMERRGVQRP
ncbi:MAG: hypothetical protein A4C66_10740 [Nitrospira sp. HN-bin3]|nr:MAG: hypothetical protein A4C66_10740 [Nitrospira sp. HN-bin3]